MKKTDIHCLGFIMDGNRRWAKEQGKETIEGHAKGFELFKEVVDWVKEADIPHAVFYAFSTENWKRTKEEVGYLMGLFEKSLRDFLEKNDDENGVRVRVIGQRTDFSPAMQQLMNDLEENSKSYTGTTIWIALSYGGRAEIVAATNKAIEKGESVTEETFGKLLWTADMPDPDMVVRTSGEHRLSNFLPWQAVYSELYFIDKHWPSLTKNDFEDILMEYEKRERRKGK